MVARRCAVLSVGGARTRLEFRGGNDLPDARCDNGSEFPFAVRIEPCRQSLTDFGDSVNAERGSTHLYSDKAVWILAFAGMTPQTPGSSFPRSLFPTPIGERQSIEIDCSVAPIFDRARFSRDCFNRACAASEPSWKVPNILSKMTIPSPL